MARWIENIKDPRNSKTIPITGIQDPAEIEKYDQAIQGKIIGDPVPHDEFAKYFSAEEMKELGWVGLYVEEDDHDLTPAESLRQSLQEAREGKRLPLEQMWDGIEEDGDND